MGRHLASSSQFSWLPILCAALSALLQALPVYLYLSCETAGRQQASYARFGICRHSQTGVSSIRRGASCGLGQQDNSGLTGRGLGWWGGREQCFMETIDNQHPSLNMGALPREQNQNDMDWEGEGWRVARTPTYPPS